MPHFVSALIDSLGYLLRSRRSLTFQVLALQHQVAVYKQSVHRPRLKAPDCVFRARLSRLRPGCQEALGFVQPRSVIAWQRRRFRDHWRRSS